MRTVSSIITINHSWFVGSARQIGATNHHPWAGFSEASRNTIGPASRIILPDWTALFSLPTKNWNQEGRGKKEAPSPFKMGDIDITEVKNMKVAALRKHLTDMGLNPKGNKPELVERLENTLLELMGSGGDISSTPSHAPSAPSATPQPASAPPPPPPPSPFPL